MVAVWVGLSMWLKVATSIMVVKGEDNTLQ